jgi:F0F1-type ATP synthase assembly protein I
VTTDDQARARLSHRLVTAQVVGKSSLGLGFIVSIFGVTDHNSWALRTGLALLLMGMIASFVSLVHSFNRRRLSHQSMSNSAGQSGSDSTRPPKDRRPS